MIHTIESISESVRAGMRSTTGPVDSRTGKRMPPPNCERETGLSVEEWRALATQLAAADAAAEE